MPKHDESRRMTRRFTILTGTASAVAAVLILAVTVAAQTTQRFGDVPTDHYAFDSVNWAVENEITEGCGDGTNFCPEQNLNRAHMVTFLKRYHDRFGGPITVSWSDPLDTSDGVTLTGIGSDLTQALTVTEGRYRVTLSAEGSDVLGNVFLTVLDDASEEDALVIELVDGASYSRTTQFEVGDGIFNLAPGRIWLEVEVSQGVEWTIVVAPLSRR